MVAKEHIGSTIATIRALLSVHTPPPLLKAAHPPVGNQPNSFVILNLLCVARGSLLFSSTFNFGTLDATFPTVYPKLTTTGTTNNGTPTLYTTNKGLTSSPRNTLITVDSTASSCRSVSTLPFDLSRPFSARDACTLSILATTKHLERCSCATGTLYRSPCASSISSWSREVASGRTRHPWIAVFYRNPWSRQYHQESVQLGALLQRTGHSQSPRH